MTTKKRRWQQGSREEVVMATRQQGGDGNGDATRKRWREEGRERLRERRKR